MPVDARALVEPALLHRRVHPDGDDVVAAVVEVVGEVVAEASVAARVAAEVEAVDPHDRVAKHAVELDADAPAEVGGRDGEDLAIPADGTPGNVEPAGLVSVAGTGFGVEWRLHGPIVRQIELPPPAVFECRGGRTVGITGLGHIGEFAGPVEKITGLVEWVPKGETPAGVHEQTLAWQSSDRIGSGESRRCEHRSEQQSANDRIHGVNRKASVLHESVRRSSRHLPRQRAAESRISA